MHHPQEFISADGVKIVYNIYGSGDPALIFIHCWCGNREFWKHQVEYFSKKNKCVVLDLAGHGDSGKNRKNWTIDSYANDLAALIDILKAQQIILVAHSIGGIIALEAVKKSRENIAGIISVDTFNNIDFKISEDEINEFIKPYERDFEATISEYVGPFFTTQTEIGIRKKITDTLTSTDHKIAIAVLREYLRYDQSAELKKLNLPLICLNSDRLHGNASNLKGVNEKIELITVNDSGHFMMIDKYERFNLELQNAINKINLNSSKK